MPTWPFVPPTSPQNNIVHSTVPIDDTRASPASSSQQNPGSYNNGSLESRFDGLNPSVPPLSSSASARARATHGRSLSATLPSLFGSKKLTTLDQDTHPSLSPSPDVPGSIQNLQPGAKDSRSIEEAFESGFCATCASKVKWPKHVAEYRCGNCLMINSSKSSQPRRLLSVTSQQPVSRTGIPLNRALDKKGAPLTLERTRVIIDRCLDTFLKDAVRKDLLQQISVPLTQLPISASPTNVDSQINTTGHLVMHSDQIQPIISPIAQKTDVRLSDKRRFSPRKDSKSSPDHDSNTAIAHKPLSTNVTGKTKVEAGAISYDEDMLSSAPSRKVPAPLAEQTSKKQYRIPRKTIPQPEFPQSKHGDIHPEVVEHEESTARVFQLAKTVFGPLEDYIAQSFGHHALLNVAFSSNRPRLQKSAKSEENPRTRGTASDVNVSTTQIPDIDAKLLLLGDFAENGLWWTGADTGSTKESPAKGEAVESLGRKMSNLVHTRSPRINWVEADDWYQAVITVGQDWRKKLDGSSRAHFSDFEKKKLLENGNDIDSVLRLSRLHVQKTILRTSEALLKHPGCGIHNPDDMRFLLLLLANPLLYPVSTSKLLLQVAQDLQVVSAPVEQSRDSEATTNIYTNSPLRAYWERGSSFGTIKRILGILSNLSNECHRCLTSWLSRYREEPFRRTFQMIQSFVTYRLGRQVRRDHSDSVELPSLIPSLPGTRTATSAQLHAALGLGSQSKNSSELKHYAPPYTNDWQVRAAARVMALLFAANKNFHGERLLSSAEASAPSISTLRSNFSQRKQLAPTSEFYNIKLDSCDLIGDFEAWETSKSSFTFCQYPFFLTVGGKIRIMEHDARRQMEVKAREAFFESLLKNKDLQQYLYLKVRRECLIEDSLTAISQVVGQGQQEIKKGLRVQFLGEEGIDAGGLRKEWFLLLVREIFEPNHGQLEIELDPNKTNKSLGMFLYDEDSNLCYFNPHAFEASEQYFLVGALLGLAIYNSTILDVALPPFLFKKLMASGSSTTQHNAFNRTPMQYTLDDLSELRPSLAKGLHSLLHFEGDVQETYCRDFVAEVERYGTTELVPLCPNGADRQVTNSNRQEFVDLYVRFLLDTQVARQYEPFKRGFFTVCGGNALSLFQPEEIELLVRGSDERLDISSLKAVAVYENWSRNGSQSQEQIAEVSLVRWFWEFFETTEPWKQRKILGFITGSDRIPALGATSLVIKIAYAGREYDRFPIARTCFNLLLLYKYRTKEELVGKLWRAISESEGFGLK